MGGRRLGVGGNTDWDGGLRDFEAMAMLRCVLNVTGVTGMHPFAEIRSLYTFDGFIVLSVTHVSRKVILKC